LWWTVNIVSNGKERKVWIVIAIALVQVALVA
jgi:hypothetical protein